MRVFTCLLMFLISGVAWCGVTTLPGDSIFHLDTKWTTQEGKEFRLGELRGRPTLISMVYLTCGYSCPAVISAVQAIEAKLGEKARLGVQVVLVSFDPERDTPEKMRENALKYGTDGKRWRWITHKDDSKIRELAAALNFKYQKSGKSDFTHSFMIAVLGAEGNVLARIDSAGQDRAPLIEILENTSRVR